jgi:hypothetical protein
MAKGVMTRTGPKIEEVTRGRRKVLRRTVDHRHRKWHEAEERCYDEQWITDTGSDMRVKKGVTTSSGSKTQEVTWGWRKVLRRAVDQRHRKWHEAEGRHYDEQWIRDRGSDMRLKKVDNEEPRDFFFTIHIRLMKRLERVVGLEK